MLWQCTTSKVSYKTNLIFNFMSFIGNFRKEKVEKMNSKFTKKTWVLAIISPNMLKMASNG